MSKTSKRNLFAELMEGVNAMQQSREGKITLRTHKVGSRKTEHAPGAEYFVAVREKFNVSRSVWADMLRVSPRTVEKWEQGGQVSPLAATFVELVEQYPDTIERLQTLPKRVPRRTALNPGKVRRARQAATATAKQGRTLAR
jgi:putative transcriptional regulator